jgi:hypothetical protein
MSGIVRSAPVWDEMNGKAIFLYYHDGPGCGMMGRLRASDGTVELYENQQSHHRHQ